MIRFSQTASGNREIFIITINACIKVSFRNKNDIKFEIRLCAINNGIFEKLWAAMLFKFQWQKDNSGEVFDFGPGFTCMSSDKSNKHLMQNIALAYSYPCMGHVWLAMNGWFTISDFYCLKCFFKCNGLI